MALRIQWIKYVAWQQIVPQLRDPVPYLGPLGAEEKGSQEMASFLPWVTVSAPLHEGFLGVMAHGLTPSGALLSLSLNDSSHWMSAPACLLSGGTITMSVPQGASEVPLRDWAPVAHSSYHNISTVFGMPPSPSHPPYSLTPVCWDLVPNKPPPSPWLRVRQYLHMVDLCVCVVIFSLLRHRINASHPPGPVRQESPDLRKLL